MRVLPCALIAQFVFVAASPLAHAFDWSTDDRRILGDPSFLPTGGQVSGSFSYTYSANLYDVSQNYDAIFHGSYDRSANAFVPALQYGLTDDISLFANFQFGNTRTRESYTRNDLVLEQLPNAGGFYYQTVVRGGKQSFRAIGAVDPVFGVTWRAIDQRTAPVSVDLIGSYSPDIFQSRESTGSQTGSIASGGQAGSAELAVSREMRFFTLRAFGTFTYEGRRNERGVGDEDLRSAPHPSYTVGLQSEMRPLPWLAINAGVSAAQAVQYDRFLIFPNGRQSETIKPSGSITPYAGVVVPLLDNHAVGELLYQHDFVNNEAIDQSFGDVRYYKQESNLFTARILFAFGGAPLPLPATGTMPPPPMAGPAPQPARTYLVFFDWDRADLTARARQIVAQAAQASTRAPTRIEVNGYTDLSGTAAYNQRLSVRRAQTVQAELLRDGVAAGDISIHGFGETNPLVQTAAGVREPQNRRVEILLR